MLRTSQMRPIWQRKEAVLISGVSFLMKSTFSEWGLFMTEKLELSVGGYTFLTEKDAQLARAEEKRIEYLEGHIDYSRPEEIRYVYEKTIRERMFKTPVGLEYLKRMRSYLLAQAEINPTAVPDIPLYGSFDGEIREQPNPARTRIKPSAKKEEKKRFRFTVSVILNIVLALVIISMFSISLNSENPNILNYEKNLVNRYAAWEEELTQREQAVREKERELTFTE